MAVADHVTLPGGLLPPSERGATANLALLGLAGIALTLHFAGGGRYGFFRDELYYIACGKHLAWGYVDQPPLIALIARISETLWGESLRGFRFLPAAANAGLVFLAGKVAQEFGGRRVAQLLAAAAVLIAPVYLAFGSFLSMNVFEPLFWMGCAYILIRILKGAGLRLWVAFGALAGVGVLNKHTMLLFAFALVLGMLLTRERSRLGSRWIWIGALVALILILPNLIWEARNGWPQFEVVRSGQIGKNTIVSPLRFAGEQILFLGPAALPIVVAGFVWLVVSRRYRCFVWAAVLVEIAVRLLHGKTYYPMPLFPLILAAGSVGLENWLWMVPRRIAVGYLALFILGGALMAPFGVPLLPVSTLTAYQRAIRIAGVVRMERDSESSPPQLYRDMFGWENLTATIAKVYYGLPVSDREKCAILAGNYGEAGAVDLLGARDGLPKAISGHNNYFLWGPRDYTGEVVILFGEHSEEIKTLFGQVEQAATISNPQAAAAERYLPVYVCRRPAAPLSVLWPRFKFYI